MNEILSILQLGNPLLREIAQPIGCIDDPYVQTLIARLLATVKQASGVGIAAPQVGNSCRLLVIASRPNPRYPHAPEMEPTAMINPEIVAKSHEQEKGWEGCLSVPGIRGLVPRHRAIEVEYLSRDGQKCRQELTDFVARIFQHEYDHLEGKVFLDRVESTQDLMTEAEYELRVNNS
jgi:peptide deformylase